MSNDSEYILLINIIDENTSKLFYWFLLRTYLLWWLTTLNIIRLTATSIPIVVITHMHISNGIDNVRNTRRITVLSCGILPPIKKKKRTNILNVLYPPKIIITIQTFPSLFIEPSQIIKLRVVIAEFNVFPVNDLFDLRQCYPITLRTESHPTLKFPSIYKTIFVHGETLTDIPRN